MEPARKQGPAPCIDRRSSDRGVSFPAVISVFFFSKDPLLLCFRDAVCTLPLILKNVSDK